MALTDEQKQRIRQAAASRNELHRQGAFYTEADLAAKARDEASRVRVKVPDAASPGGSKIVTGREYLSTPGTAFSVWGAQQAQAMTGMHQAYQAGDLRKRAGSGIPQRTVQDLSRRKELETVRAAAAQREKDFRAYLDSPEYKTGERIRQARAAEQARQQMNMFYRNGMNPDFAPVPKMVVEKDEKAEAFRRELEGFHAIISQIEQEQLMENVDVLADLAEREHQDYIHSEAYVARSREREQEKLQRMAMANAMGVVPGYQALFSYTDEDQKEQELRSKASYLRSLADRKRDTETMNTDLEELKTWPAEDQQALAVFAVNQIRDNADPLRAQTLGPLDAQGQAKAIIEKYGLQKVREMAESYLRSQTAQAAQQAALAFGGLEQGAGPEGMGFGEGFGHSAASVAANLAGSAIAVPGYLTELGARTGRYKTMDPNNPGQLPSIYAGAARQAVSENFSEAGKAIYQAGMNALDNLARVVVGGKVGSLALAATGSFGSAVREYSQRGVDPLMAVGMGVLRGGIEVVTEKISLDNLLTEAANPKTLSQFLTAAFKAGAVEVSEEELGLILSAVLEAWKMREQSGYNRRVAELQAMGLSSSQAREQASLDLILEAGETAIQSFLSGGMMSGAANIVTGARQAVQDAKLRSTVKDAAKQLGKQGGTALRGEAKVSTETGVEVAQETMEAAQRMSAATGREIRFYAEPGGADGFYERSTGVIHVNTRGVNPYAQIVSHELTHSVEMAESYKQISKLVLDRIRATGGDLTKLRQEKAAQYERRGIRLNGQAEVDSEIVASYVANHLLTDEAEITSLVRQDYSLGEKIRNWLDGLLAKLTGGKAAERVFIRKARDAYARALDQTKGLGKAAPAGNTIPFTSGKAQTQNAPTGTGQTGQAASVSEDTGELSLKEQRQKLNQDYHDGRITEKEFDALMDEMTRHEELVGVDAMAWEDQRFRGEDGAGRQYSIQELPDGKKYVQADRQVILGNDPDSWSEQVEDYINGKIRRGQDVTLSGEDGKPLRITKDTAGKMADMHDSRGRTLDEEVFEVKANAAVHIDELVQISEEVANTWRPDKGGRHGDFASGGWRYRTAFFQDFDGKYYRLRISVATGTDGDTVYNLGDIEERSFPKVDGSSAKGGALMDGKASSGTKVTQNSDKVNRKFSIPETVSNPENESVRIIHDEHTVPKSPLKETQHEGHAGLSRFELYPGDFNRLEKAERNLQGALTDILGIPYRADRNRLVEDIQALSEYALQADIPTPQIDAAFDAFLNKGRWSNQEYYQKYSGLRDILAATELQLSEAEREALADNPKLLRRAARGLRMMDDGGKSLQEVYQELKSAAPDLFRGEKTGPAEQLKQILDVGDSLNRSLGALDSFYGEASGAYQRTMQSDFANAMDTFLDEVYAVRDSAARKAAASRERAARLQQAEPNAAPSANISSEAGAQLPQAEEGKPDTGAEPKTTVKEIRRENLNSKATDRLKSAEWKLMHDIGNVLGVPYLGKRDTLLPLLREMSDEYLRTGMVSEETRARIFEAAYEEGMVIDREFYDQYKDIKDILRTTAVTISRQDQSDIADFRDFRRRANRGKILRITEDGGLPVDTFYQQMQELAPELFPRDITHPADQLQRLYDVAQSIVVSESSLDAYYGPNAAEFKKTMRSDFDSALTEAIAKELRNVRRYGEDKLFSKEETEILTVEEAEEIGHKLKKARRNYEKVNAKHLLTHRDELIIGRLLRGETQLEHLQGEENFESIRAVYEAKREYEEYAALLSRYKRQCRRKNNDLADSFLETAMTWKDKKSGILYSRETMRRNIFDIIPEDPELAERIVEEYFEPVHRNEALSTRFKQEYRDRVRDMGLSRKVNKGDLVSEAHAVQLLGEAMDNIRILENARGRMKTRDGRTLLEWQAVVQNLWAENPGLNQAGIEAAVQEFRKIYDELFRKMNRVRLENGYEPVSYRQGYFPHFQPGDGDGVMAYFGRILGIDVSVEALPTTINGLTHTFKPGIQWFGNAQERLGFNTAYDAVEGFDKYIEGVSSVIHHTADIQKLRALATQVRYRTSDEGLRERVNEVQKDVRLNDEERQMKIRDIYEHGRFELANFVAELDEYTNLLANKKSKYDRSMEALMGRRAYTVMKRVESKVGANMIAGNLSSAFTNFIPLTQAVGRIGIADMSKGIRDTALAVLHKDKSIVGMSDFLTNRRGGDVLVKNWQDKLSDKLGIPMELIDNIVSESIVRAAYQQQKRTGLSDSEAMHQADVLAASIMADRSKGAMPTLFEASNPIAKLFTQFQLEVNNQYSEIFKDMPRAYNDKSVVALALAFTKYFLAAFLWNELEEKMKGRRSALDPIDALRNFFRDWKEASEWDAVSNLSVTLLEGLPFSSALNYVGLDLDGGRVPVASAIPDLSAMGKALFGRDLKPQQRKKDFFEEFQKPITYVLMPAAGNQISKAWKAIAAYAKGGSYSLDQDGKEILQYPIYKDTAGEKAGNLLKGAFFGKSSLATAQEWVESGFDSLSAKETAVYQDLLESGQGAREAYEVLKRVQAVPHYDAKTVENAGDLRRKDQWNIILNDDALSEEARAILYYGLAATEREQEMMDKLVDAGAGYDGLVKFVGDLLDIGTWTAADDRKDAYRKLLASSGLTEEEKLVAVEAFMDPVETTESGGLSVYGKLKEAISDGLSVNKFMEMYASGASMDKYFDMHDAGIRAEQAADLVVEMAGLEPLPGKKSVSWDQQCDVILDSRLTAAEQAKALEAVSHESTGAKIRIGYENGLPPGALVYLKRALPEFDSNGNGSYAYKEVTAAIDAVSGDDNLIYTVTGTSPHGFRLTEEQKAVLWQLQTGAKDGKSNPYDRDIGKMIYDLVQADKEARDNE